VPRVLIPEMAALPRLPIGAVSQQASGQTMGTTWTVKWIDASARRLESIQCGVQRVLDGVVSQMSNWDPASCLSEFNRAPPDTWHVLPRPFFDVLACSLLVAQATDGAFDPAVEGLVNLWGFGPAARRSRIPVRSDLARLRAQSNWRRLRLDAERCAAYQPGTVALDFSAIAKGFGVDQVAGCLDRFGIESYLVEVGGELYGRGIKVDGMPWWVDLETPPAEDDAESMPPPERTVVALHEMAVATSGDYRRFHRTDTQRYSHILDPRTGEPAQNGVAAVTVLHQSCMLADAYSTALMVLGVTEGLEVAKRLDLAARFICRTADGLREHITPRFAAMLD